MTLGKLQTPKLGKVPRGFFFSWFFRGEVLNFECKQLLYTGINADELIELFFPRKLTGSTLPKTNGKRPWK